jgi:hypothetical protein
MKDEIEESDDDFLEAMHLMHLCEEERSSAEAHCPR